MEWLDLKGQPVPAESHFSVSASTGLMAVLSIVTPQDTAVGGLTCSISNPLLPEKVTETYLLGEYLFSSKTRTRPWVPGMLGEGYADRARESSLQPSQEGCRDVGFQDDAGIGKQGDPLEKQERSTLILAFLLLSLFFNGSWLLLLLLEKF